MSAPVVREDIPLFHGMVGAHLCMRRLFRAIERATGVDAPIVVWGATGTGKELVARALHALVAPSGPLCPVNVAALPDGLVESELFGTVRGAYTGAATARAGLLEAAEGGVLFLDEACELRPAVQAKLLRVLETGEVRRLGSTATRCSRFRLVLAVQHDPATLRSDGRWREDFYHRVAGVVLRVPSLAERRTDLPLLAKAFVRRQGLPSLDRDAIGVLEAYDWPGNVRELQRVLVRAAFHAEGEVIDRAAVTAALGVESSQAPLPRERWDLVRRSLVRDAVSACGGNKRRAADALGISRRHLYRLLNRAPMDQRESRLPRAGDDHLGTHRIGD